MGPGSRLRRVRDDSLHLRARRPPSSVPELSWALSRNTVTGRRKMFRADTASRKTARSRWTRR